MLFNLPFTFYKCRITFFFFSTSGHCYDTSLCMFIFPFACSFSTLDSHWSVLTLVHIYTLYFTITQICHFSISFLSRSTQTWPKISFFNCAFRKSKAKDLCLVSETTKCIVPDFHNYALCSSSAQASPLATESLSLPRLRLRIVQSQASNFSLCCCDCVMGSS